MKFGGIQIGNVSFDTETLDSGLPITKQKEENNDLMSFRDQTAKTSLADRSSDGYLYTVQFKRTSEVFIISKHFSSCIMPHDFVIVEGDRGEDMGIVLAKTLLSELEGTHAAAGTRNRSRYSDNADAKCILRAANAVEKATLVFKVEHEENALQVSSLMQSSQMKIGQIIRRKVQERSMPMVILDVEYQFDRRKLTVYYEAYQRVDFRDLIQYLFLHYKTRIWMHQVDTMSPLVDITNEGLQLAKAAGFLPKTRAELYSGFALPDSTCSSLTSDAATDNNSSNAAATTPIYRWSSVDKSTADQFGQKELHVSPFLRNGLGGIFPQQEQPQAPQISQPWSDGEQYSWRSVPLAAPLAAPCRTGGRYTDAELYWDLPHHAAAARAQRIPPPLVYQGGSCSTGLLCEPPLHINFNFNCNNTPYFNQAPHEGWMPGQEWRPRNQQLPPQQQYPQQPW